MNLLLSTFPIAVLVAFSQIIVKWRMNDSLAQLLPADASMIERLRLYLTDPYIFSAYAAGLAGSFLWLYVIARLPLAIAFPVYQGLTFVLVIVGSFMLLGEPLSWTRLLAVALIMAGIALGVQE